MELPKLDNLDLKDKKVIVRADLDFDPSDTENFRLKTLLPTLDAITQKGGKIILMGHRGRPGGTTDSNLSLSQFKKVFEKWNVEVLENLRFDPREEANDEGFAKELAVKGDIYVNEAFSASHRPHASIVGLPREFKSKSRNSVALGLRFVQEVENLSKVLENPKRPVISIISGLKDDKLAYIEDFKKFSDKVLIAGRLPDYIHDASAYRSDPKILIASLIADKEDITIHALEAFEKEIQSAGTIVVSGPLGKFEEDGHRQGTARVFKTVADSGAFKVAGGGDTISALNLLGLTDKFDWVSVGGGAMLEFLAKGTLPGIEALVG